MNIVRISVPYVSRKMLRKERGWGEPLNMTYMQNIKRWVKNKKKICFHHSCYYNWDAVQHLHVRAAWSLGQETDLL